MYFTLLSYNIFAAMVFVCACVCCIVIYDPWCVETLQCCWRIEDEGLLDVTLRRP